MAIQVKTIESLNEFVEAIRIRVDVFIKEQKCPPGWEPDQLDKSSKHFIALLNGEIVATARLGESQDLITKLERMAVKKEYRGKGVGKALLLHIIKFARQNGFKKIYAQAQVQAEPFYRKNGFITVSGAYDLYNLKIPHVDMEYSLV